MAGVVGTACLPAPAVAPVEPVASVPSIAVETNPTRCTGVGPGACAFTFGTGGTTSAAVVSEVTPSDRETKVAIDAMWVQLGPPAIGGLSPVTLTTAPSNSGAVRVGFYEEFANGLGPEWRAGVWLAAFVSATTLNKDLTEFKFTAETAGFVDGASASGLMSAAFLAAMTGAPVDPLATMTGMLNPDGTLAPVGGIAEKFAGAIQLGKKRLGYPVGMRRVNDASGKVVDLVELAKSRGAEAFEVPDVNAAYELMTGRALPRPQAVDPADMALEPDVVTGYARLDAEWGALLASEWKRLTELRGAGKFPTGLAPVVALAQELAQEADGYRRRGVPTLAYLRTTEAWIYAATATATAEILQRVITGQVDLAAQTLRQFADAASTAEEAVRSIGQRTPTSTDGHLQMLAAFEHSISGLAAQFQAKDAMVRTGKLFNVLRGLPTKRLGGRDVHEEILAVITPTVLSIARAAAGGSTAMQTMTMLRNEHTDDPCSALDIGRLATSFQSAAAANVTYFEVLFGISSDRHRNAVARRERDYLIAYTAANLPRLPGVPLALKKDWGGDSVAWGLLTLAAEQVAFWKASMLISQFYSLRVEMDDETGRPTAVEHETGFANMLSSAERKAREYAFAARAATGFIPLQARVEYQNARALVEGDVESKLASLERYWAASGYAQTAVMLTRN